VRADVTSQFVSVCKKSGRHSIMSVICRKGGNFLALTFMGNNAILLCQVQYIARNLLVLATVWVIVWTLNRSRKS